MNVLVLSPHTDDGELGAGGTIVRLGWENATIRYIAFSRGTASDREVLNATAVLGIGETSIYDFPTRMFLSRRQEILQTMIGERSLFSPDLVFCPSRHTHQDHEVIRTEAIRAFKHSTILGYEQPWNDVVGFIPQCYYRLEEQHIQRKIEAFACYETQRERAYGDPSIFKGLARVRGTAVGAEFAEAFEVVRWIL